MKEKSDLSGVMLGLIENLKNNYDMQVQYLHCDNVGENVAFEKSCNRKGWGLTSNIMLQANHNKMAVPNKNLLVSSISSTGYLQCSTAEQQHFSTNGLWAEIANI